MVRRPPPRRGEAITADYLQGLDGAVNEAQDIIRDVTKKPQTAFEGEATGGVLPASMTETSRTTTQVTISDDQGNGNTFTYTIPLSITLEDDADPATTLVLNFSP